jgi:uncharacterized tellurite resistance protein B-like protein
MLSTAKQFFQRHIHASRHAPDAAHGLQVATAALLFEVMRTDGVIQEIERHAVLAAIQAQFALTATETAELLRLAEARAHDATDYYQFTSLINQHFTADQKAQVVEYLWQVAYADHEIDRFERTLVHKVADLLYVPRAAQIAARDRVIRAAGRTP